MKSTLTTQFVCPAEATFIIKHLLPHLPVLALQARYDKIRVAQQGLLGFDIGGHDPAQRHAGGTGVRADKELLKGCLLYTSPSPRD